MRYFKTELLIALSTCSSEAVLPQLVRKLEHLGVERSVVGLVIPAGFSFNLDGSAIYLTMASLFLAQAVGIDLSWQQQLIMVGVMMLTSKGTAGIAGGAFIVLASTITAVGHVPLAALALIVGIDRLLNEGRVFINVLGNAIGAIVIGKWENEFDGDRAREVLAGRREFNIEDEDDDIDQPAADRTAGRRRTRTRQSCPTRRAVDGTPPNRPIDEGIPMSRVLVTTDYLHPGDEVDALLRKHGHQVSYRPAVGAAGRPRRRWPCSTALTGAIVASEPVTAEMLDRATDLTGSSPAAVSATTRST